MHILFPKHFLSQINKLEKKFKSIRRDVFDSLKIFNIEHSIHIGKNVYKIRISSSDINKGKSGAFRAYIYVKFSQQKLAPLCIYFKSERESITIHEIAYLLRKAKEEFLDYL
ncbi:MAG: hypothetical protein UR28_C0004G0018 [Candidatus Peregrinibacteria bacterium GW2011_GWF2_33_10]|nr:MAG: hypothetical protein UR28_C0004G0018 [Candidatus Peregrinibacteria bacterium GW2011_GWF2_33_10]OGJ44618.1 MAG: hypothetical protein A2263_00025 [Candidatus Peregrinibacteria bacterium RIFOXYA2_FULL_33_21]OGJ46436.1 MAG: hypothetical protein A2272_06720 [Candidatus Peregrinibacteria bacterium RIFOXYA12_FULL_33_12]